MTEEKLDLFIDLSQPDSVSPYIDDLDTIQIHFKYGNIFMDSEDFTTLEQNLMIEASIIP